MNRVEIPMSAEDFLRQGDARIERGDYLGAQEDYNGALLLNPDYAKAYAQRGLVFLHLKDNSAALKDFQKAAELFLAQGNLANYQLVRDYAQKIQQPVGRVRSV